MVKNYGMTKTQRDMFVHLKVRYFIRAKLNS